jgi:hypothetical protein
MPVVMIRARQFLSRICVRAGLCIRNRVGHREWDKTILLLPRRHRTEFMRHLRDILISFLPDQIVLNDEGLRPVNLSPALLQRALSTYLDLHLDW